MNTKRVLALLLAVLMLVALFTACSNDKPAADSGSSSSGSSSSGSSSSSSSSSGSSSSSSSSSSNTPDETEMPKITYMGSRGNGNTDKAIEGHWETFEALKKIVADRYHLDYTWDAVEGDAQLTTLNGLIASNNLPDVFNTREVIDDTSLNNLAFGGRLAIVDDVLEHTEYAKGYYNDQEKLLYLKAFATVSDGNWYYVPLPNTTGSSFNFSNSKYPTSRTGQIHGAYSVCVRQDWLNKLGLAMPTNADEFFETLAKFQENDMNGTGAAEERYIGLLGSDFQTSGVGQWYGLPYTDWVEDPSTGAIEVSCLINGYKEFLTYSNKLYNNNMMYVEGRHPWGNGTVIATNEIAAIGMMPTNLQFWNTGEDGSYYMPMPPVKGFEGADARLLVQESKAAFIGFSFRKDVDLEAAGRLMDFLVDRDVFNIFRYGIEGKKWDYANDEKTAMVAYNLETEEELQSYGPAGTYWLGGTYYPINGGHHGNLWGIPQATYNDIDTCLAAGEPYTQNSTTKEEWQQQQHLAHNVSTDVIDACEQYMLLLKDYGLENLHVTAYYSYTTMATNEEAEILSQYATDLKTYLQEMTTNVIVGSTSVDGIDDQVQFAFDNLGLKEYYNIMQTKVNRYRKAFGEPEAPLMP